MTWPDGSPSGLQVIEKAQIDGNIESQHVALCDAHDLVAVLNAGTASETAVTVYRLKGEIAFTVALRHDDELRPLSLQWKPDGTLLAVTWSDAVCCLYSGENGRLLYELPTKRADASGGAVWSLDINAPDTRNNEIDAEEAAADSTALSAPIVWTSYDDGQNSGSKIEPENEDVTTDDFFDMMTAGPTNGAKRSHPSSRSSFPELINSITTLDATSVLPRLSRIETSTGMRYSPEGNKFNTQVSTDIIFDASSFAPGIFSTLLASEAQGAVTVFMDETIRVGHMQLSGSEQVCSASSSECSSQVIVSRDTEHQGLYQLNFIDLPLDRLGSSLNHVISLNTRRLQSLMSYITHAIRCIHQEIQTGIKGVPFRLMKLLEEDLRSASGETAPTFRLATIELQHLALTSNFHPVVLEWLKDIVKETGHKRWDQATNAMYEHIEAYLFKNLLPALQRFVAAASALRGQAGFHQHTGLFAIRLDILDTLIQWADTLGLVAQRTLRAVTEEHIQFKAFSKWLRVMIDIAVAGPGTKGADETEEREAPNYDMDLCLRYIDGPLMESSLKVFAESVSPSSAAAAAGSKEEFFGQSIMGDMSRVNTLSTLQKLDTPASGRSRPSNLTQRTKDHTGSHPSDPINLPLLTCLLKAHTRIAIEEISVWQSQAVPRTAETISLEGLIENGKVWDMRVSSPPSSAGQEASKEIVHILTSDEENSLQIITVTRPKTKESTPSPPELRTHRISLPPSSGASENDDTPATILHAAFTPPLHDKKHQNSPFPAILLLLAHPSSPSPSSAALLHLPAPSASRWKTLHTWPTASYLSSPQHFVVGGRPGKRMALVFSPAAAGRGATRWEALDLEGGGDDGSSGRDGDVDMEVG